MSEQSPSDLTDEQRVSYIHGFICVLHRYIRAGKPLYVKFALERLAEFIPTTSTKIMYDLRRTNWDVINACWLIDPGLSSAYADETRLNAETSGQPPADAAADAGWLIALGLQTMQTGYSSVPLTCESFKMLETVLGEGLSDGVAITFIERIGPMHMHRMSRYVYARSWHAQPDESVRAIVAGGVVSAAADIVAATTAASPDRCRPPPALAEFHRLMSIPGTDDQKIDRLAASSGRESVAALVVSCLNGSPATCQSRIMRVLTTGNIRPADALAIIVALMYYPGVSPAADFLDEVAVVLAEQFVSGVHSRSPIGLSHLHLPPVIV